ncbi:MalM family protein [uncultured Salinicola sp.]|uniref:MalM family protein n=1 Tax=uncultured Salinicola sp. TaxID=1193542 RepID=UPI00262B09C4|nr:MalM family protein [uncultured Salinicola sp.]
MLSSYRLAVPLGTLLFALAGCSTPLMAPQSPTIPAQQGQQALASAPDCCTSLASLPYQPISAQETLTLDFTPQAPVHDFGDGKSFFRAFELPRNNGPVAISVTSPIRDGQVFAPTILILDSAFQPVRQIPSDSLQVRRPTGFSTARLEGQFSLTPGPDAQYLVIYSSEQDRRGSTSYESEAKAYARVRGLAEPPGPDPLAVHAATGTLTLEIASLTGNPGLTPLTAAAPPPANRPTPSGAGSVAPAVAPPPAPATTNEAADFDYRRMIDAALKAGDIELALELADRAERSGHPGTRAWLAERLQTRTP